MQVLKLLHEMSSDALYVVHLRRRLSVWAAVGGVLRGRRLWLTHIGRSLDSGTSEKHAIKRVDRLLGNRQLAGERLAVVPMGHSAVGIGLRASGGVGGLV